MSSMNKNAGVKRVECKVCYDAGKGEREYNGHRVKDREGRTVCPTLLSMECRYCKKKGHTVKYCTKASMPLPLPKTEKVERKEDLFPALTKKTTLTTSFPVMDGYKNKVLIEKVEEVKKEMELKEEGFVIRPNQFSREELREMREENERRRKREEYLGEYLNRKKTWMEMEQEEEDEDKLREEYGEEKDGKWRIHILAPVEEENEDWY